MASVGTVTLDLDANAVKLLRELKKSQQQTQRAATSMQRSMKRAFSEIKRSAAALGTTLVGVFSARSLRSIADAGLKMQQFERALKVATGSSDNARRELGFVINTANELGLSLESTAGSYAKLAAAAKGTALQGQASRDIFVGISQASRVLGLSAEQTSGALTAIEQIISKGKVSAEELRGQLGERLPGAFQLAARSIGVTTAALDDMLKKGELTAEDLLPKLAQELKTTFGPEVEAAANDAQGAINRFETAVFQLKNEIASGGVLDSLAALARGGTAVTQAFSGAVFNANPFAFEKEIDDARDKIAELNRELAQNINVFTGQPFDNERTKKIQAEIEAQEKLIKTLIRKQEIEFGLGPAAKKDSNRAFADVDRANAELDALFKSIDEDYARSLETFAGKFETAEEKAASLRAEIERFRADLTPGQLKNAQAAVTDILTSGIEEIDIGQIRKLRKEVEGVKKSGTDLGLTFASAFEDAIVKGGDFRDILKGIYQDILRILVRKTITEPLGNFFSDAFGGIFGGGKADGGPVQAGVTYKVGERGAELFTPATDGVIIPNHKLNSGAPNISYSIHVDSRSDREQVVAALIPLLERTKQESVNSVRQLASEGRLL